MTTFRRSLTVHRGFARLEESRLGYTVAVPAMELPEGEPPAGADGTEASLGAALGWEVPQKLRGRVDAIAPWGMVAPSQWEKRYIEWLAAELGVEGSDGWEVAEREIEPDSGIGQVLDRLGRTDPWKKGTEIPPGVLIRRTETDRLEAREAAFQIRCWLADHGGVEACDQVLVLLPRSRTLVDLWVAELSAAGVPAIGVQSRMLRETAAGAWVLAWAQLVGWDQDEPRSRAVLREALDAPFWSQKAAGREGRSANRRLIRELLFSIRRPMVTHGQWMQHIEAARHSAEAEAASTKSKRDAQRVVELEDIAALSTRLAAALRAGSAQVTRFRDLLFGQGRKDGEQALNAADTARMQQDKEALDVLLRVRDELGRLERVEVAHDGMLPVPEGEVAPSIAGLLADYLSGAAMLEHRDFEHGVTLLPYELYDGRESELLVLAALSEAGFPRAPRALTGQEEQWALCLGLLQEEPGDTQAIRSNRWVEAEVERQIRLARVAISRCSGALTLSFSMEGSRDGVVHPGALLSLLVGGWTDTEWRAATTLRDESAQGATYPHASGVQNLSWGHEISEGADEARSLAEASLHAASDGVILEHLKTLAAGADCGAAIEQLERVEQLSLCNAADEELAPAPEEDAKLPGAYSGRLPARPDKPSAYSPTAIGDFAQCPYKYFLGRVLRIEEPPEEAGVPEPWEVGLIIHDALRGAAHGATDAVKRAYWDLSWHGGSDEELAELVASRLAEVQRGVDEALGEFAQDNPTASKTYLDELGRRWMQAIRNWLTGHIKNNVLVPAASDDESLAQDSEVATAWKEYETAEQTAQQAPAALAELEAAMPGFDVKTKKAMAEACIPYAERMGIRPTPLGRALGEWYSRRKGDPAAACEAAMAALRELVEAKQLEQKAAQAKEAFEQIREAERRRRELSIAAHVAFAERSFGMMDHPEPAKVDVTDVTVPLRGQIDRIDWDEERRLCAIRDYKSGASFSEEELKKRSAEGDYLQLLLYALAVEALIEEGTLPLEQGARVGEVGLEFLRDGRSARIALSGEQDSGYLLDGEPAGWLDLGRAWLAHCVGGIETGCFDLIPKKCPKVDGWGVYCDYDAMCPYRPGETAALQGREPPDIELAYVGIEKEWTAPELAQPVLPDPPAAADSPAALRKAHAQGQATSTNLQREVFVAAGAGTGKTHNLVLRYLAAVAEEQRLPGQVVCVTFSRKAAAEMRHRVRQALLKPVGEQQQEYVKALASDPARLRSVVLSLSGAPISTIDSLAAQIVREGEELCGTSRSAIGEGLGEREADAAVESFVAQRFVEALDSKDDHVAFLMEHITVAELQKVLHALVASGVPPWAEDAEEPDDMKQRVLEQWGAQRMSIEKKLRELFDRLDLKAWQAAIAAADAATKKSDRPDDDARERVLAAVAGVEAVRSDKDMPWAELWSVVDTVVNMRFSKSALGMPLMQAMEELFGSAKWHQALPARGTADAAMLKTWREVARNPALLDRLADITGRAMLVAREWHGAIVEELWSRGQPRYQDVSARAVEMLRDPELSDGLRERFPVAHLFVDESQDTSQQQIDLVLAFAELTGARLFWVGDVKQSIYRFRSAEVDVFERLLEDASKRDALRGTLRVNRRSRRPLVETFNRLFGALLPALAQGGPIDLASEMAYDCLGWPEERDDEAAEPLVELIAAPGAYWPIPPQDELEDPDAVTPAEAVVRRIAEVLEERGDATGEGAHVAVLVHSWWQARLYQRRLEEAGVRAVVQGGGGLLSTAEIDGLLRWLDAAVTEGDHAFTAALKGPGLRMSDAGLFCLRHGFGVTVDGSSAKGIRRSAQEGKLDPAAAAKAWKALDPKVSASKLKPLLARDAEALRRFQRAWQRTFARAGFVATSELFQQLVDELALAAYWHVAPGGGRQAVANLATFVDLVRELEADGVTTPLSLYQQLSTIETKDQPTASGLDAGVSADVIVTTFWQAKGLEWPVVVLPDVEKANAGNGGKGLALSRVLVPESAEAFARKEVHWMIGAAETTEAAPLSVVAVDRLDAFRQHWNGAADRAETRRLLYVAMTRAKERLIVSGTFDAVRLDNKLPHALEDGTPAYSLESAKEWATILGVCLDLRFDPDASVHLGSRSLLGADDIVVKTPEEVGRWEKSDSGAAKAPALPTEERMRLWLPLPARERRRVLPSQAEPPDAVPEPLDEVKWPPKESGRQSVFGTMDHEGSAFHEVMEAWGYGGAEGAPFAAELVQEVLERLDMADLPGSTERRDRIVKLFELSEAKQPALFEQLRQAARGGRLYPELPLSYIDDDGSLVGGYIDLAWHDDAGWHLLDYKAGWQHPTAKKSLTHPKLREHFAQTAMYARGLKKLLAGERLVDFGVWYVACGLVVRWGEEMTASR